MLARLSWLVAVVLVLAACERSSAPPQGSAPAQQQPAVEQQQGATELNLSREALADDVEVNVGDAPTVLPDLFDGSKDKPKVRTKGRVLTDKEAQTLEDSVQGVELSVEFDTN